MNPGPTRKFFLVLVLPGTFKWIISPTLIVETEVCPFLRIWIGTFLDMPRLVFIEILKADAGELNLLTEECPVSSRHIISIQESVSLRSVLGLSLIHI